MVRLGAGTVPNEKRGAQLGFQILYSGADRRLRHVQPLSRLEETAMRDNGEKGASLVDVYLGAFLASYR